MRFQNYWGYIIAADDNFEHSMAMCEKMSKLIGEYRDHTTKQAKAIIDQIHKVSGKDDGPAEFQKLTYEELSDVQKVLIDEESNVLYHRGPNKKEVLLDLKEEVLKYQENYDSQTTGGNYNSGNFYESLQF